jgi:hypothetical protein
LIFFEADFGMETEQWQTCAWQIKGRFEKSNRIIKVTFSFPSSCGLFYALTLAFF